MQKQINSLIEESLPVGSVAFVDTGSEFLKIPPGWELCTNNYAGKFLIVENTNEEDFKYPKTGGNKSISLTTNELPPHSHSMGASGSHQHEYGDIYFAQEQESGEPATVVTLPTIAGIQGPGHNGATDYGNIGWDMKGRKTELAGSHTHTINSSGAGAAFKILPPYVVMKLLCKKAAIEIKK